MKRIKEFICSEDDAPVVMIVCNLQQHNIQGKNVYNNNVISGVIYWLPHFLSTCLKDISKFDDVENRLITKDIIKSIGEPRNYGLTDEEKEELERKEAEERLAREAKERADLEQKEAEERAQKLANWDDWVSKSQTSIDSIVWKLFSSKCTQDDKWQYRERFY